MSPTIEKFIKIGQSSSNLLLSLVEDILNLSKMEAGIFAINMSEFYVKDIIDEIYDMYEQQLLRKNIELKVDFDESLNGYMIRSDKSRLKQVLINLMTNSCKFTFHGYISILVHVFSSEGNNYIKFCVSDTGIGIKKEDQSKLFKLFGMIKSNNEGQINPNG